MKNKQKAFFISKVLFALPYILFGLNKVIGFISVTPPQGKTAQIFMGAMFSTYLFKLVALTEITGSILLLIKKTSFIGMLILLPVTVNIIAYHFTSDLPGNGIWLLTVTLQLIVLYSFKDSFRNLLTV